MDFQKPANGSEKRPREKSLIAFVGRREHDAFALAPCTRRLRAARIKRPLLLIDADSERPGSSFESLLSELLCSELARLAVAGDVCFGSVADVIATHRVGPLFSKKQTSRSIPERSKAEIQAVGTTLGQRHQNAPVIG
jgi:hypothetical protein